MISNIPCDFLKYGDFESYWMRSTRNFVAMFPLNSKKSQFYHASTLAKGQSSGIKSLFPRSSIIALRLLCLQKPVWNIAMVLQFPICSAIHSQIMANASRCVIRTKLTERFLNDKNCVSTTQNTWLDHFATTITERSASWTIFSNYCKQYIQIQCWGTYAITINSDWVIL